MILLAASVLAALAPASVTVHSSAYGKILADGRGHALYAFTHDPAGRSTCAGACARAWPPFIVPGVPAAAAGVAGAKLGVSRRADGRLQATYAGRPLYHYVGDRRPGQVLCQNVVEFGGRWLVLRADGQLVH
jgi:predicted lipoprotein with Yx(FWY)xxD motif